jgi:SAM-dependent methyltransferase
MNWEECYQSGNTPWDKAAPAPELASSLSEGLLQGRVLVPGCGLGHDVRAIATAGALEVVGLDLAPSAVQEAKTHGSLQNTSFLLGDFFALPKEFTGHFDWIWEHTCFCAIPRADRPKYVQAARNALRPGGGLLALFFLNPDMEDPEQGPPFGVSPEDLDRYFWGAFALEREWLPRATYPGREGRELVRLLRRI